MEKVKNKPSLLMYFPDRCKPKYIGRNTLFSIIYHTDKNFYQELKIIENENTEMPSFERLSEKEIDVQEELANDILKEKIIDVF